MYNSESQAGRKSFPLSPKYENEVREQQNLQQFTDISTIPCESPLLGR